MLGRTLGGATVAVIQATLVFVACLLVGFRPVRWSSIPLAFLFMMLIALVFASLGTALGSILQDMQGFQLIMNFMVLPIYFLSGALYPLTNLSKPMTVITRLDPLSYGVDALRNILSGITHFPLITDFALLCGVAVIFLSLGAWLFSRIQL